MDEQVTSYSNVPEGKCEKKSQDTYLGKVY